jgi:hypothetical protein
MVGRILDQKINEQELDIRWSVAEKNKSGALNTVRLPTGETLALGASESVCLLSKDLKKKRNQE